MLTIQLSTEPGDRMINVTEAIRTFVRSSQVKRGLCHVFVPHTTAGICLNSAADLATPQDILETLRQLVPTRIDFKHQFDTPADAAGHVKSALIGQSVVLPIQNGELVSANHSILFCEFDGPRQRKCYVTIVEENPLVPTQEIRL